MSRALRVPMPPPEQNKALIPELAATGGCDTFTFSPAVARELVADPLTIAAAAEFERAASAMGKAR